MKKILFIVGIIVLINFQYSIFIKDNNIFDYFFLSHTNSKLVDHINKLNNQNKALNNEIKELKESSHALENFARYNLGLVKEDEIFVQIIEK